MKHPQNILAVDAANFIAKTGIKEGVTAIDRDAFFDVLRTSMIIGCREQMDNEVTTVESATEAVNLLASSLGLKVTVDASEFKEHKGDRSKLQLLPYCIFRVDHGNKDCEYFMYQRGSGVGESRLAGNDSFGYGGHMDLADILFDQNSIIDIEQTFENALFRELKEEVVINDSTGATLGSIRINALEPEFQGVLLDRSNDVGNLHLAAIFTFTLPLGYTVFPGEPELLPRGCFTVDEIIRNENAESWTRLIAKAL